MAPRSVGSATISFGLVSIPVKLYKATDESEAIRFNYLHDACGSRVQQQYLCAKGCGQVTHDHLALGYHTGNEQYVSFTKEEVKAIEEKATHALEITEFVPLSAVDPVYFEKSFFLAPDKTAARGYALLAKAIETSGKAALGKYASRGKGYLVLIRASAGRLILQQLYWANEVRSSNDLNIPDAPVSEKELELASMLMDAITSETFAPEKYKDDVRERMLALIEERINGGAAVTAPAAADEAPKATDLAAALAASINAAKKAAPAIVPPKKSETVVPFPAKGKGKKSAPQKGA